jgi:hypothetical protein
MAPKVKSVKVLQPYKVRLTFADGEVRDVDMEPVLDGPAFQALRDHAVFGGVEVDEFGDTIVWPNGADLDPDVLYGSERPVGSPAPRISTPQRA